MGKLARKTQEKDFILAAIAVFLFIIVLLIFLRIRVLNKKLDSKIDNQNINYSENSEKKNNENVSKPETDEEIRQYLSKLGEKSRMEYYCGEYIKCLKNKEYVKAYNMLYTEFKQKYFPTVEDFEKYVEESYPDFFAVQYDDFSRQGNIYVIRLIIIDAMNSKKSNENVQRFVVQENDFNDFSISFQVK